MKLLADENLDLDIVRWLRQEGHDVAAVAELAPSITDTAVMGLAHREQRIVISRDLDIGDLVVRHHMPVHGALLLRIGNVGRQESLALFQRCWPSVQAHLVGHLVIVSGDRIRIRPL